MSEINNRDSLKQNSKPIFVSGWFKHHGIGFLDVSLAALANSNLSDYLRPTSSAQKRRQLKPNESDQYKLAEKIGYIGKKKLLPIKQWSDVYYLIPRSKLKIDNHRAVELTEGSKWEKVIASVKRSNLDIDLQDEYAALHKEIIESKTFPELSWFKKNWRNKPKTAIRSLWHVINAAPVNTQLQWYKEYSPLYAQHEKIIHFVEIESDNIEDPVTVAKSMYNWLEKSVKNRQCVINLWGTATAIQFAWYYLSWNRPSLRDAIFLECKTPGTKTAPNSQRFVPIRVDLVPADPIGTLVEPTDHEGWESEQRREAYAWLKASISHGDNFSILLLGDRGIGKTRAAKDIWKEYNSEETFVSANCSNFSDPTHARSELFGHTKDAFSGAIEDKIGLLQKADKGLLFLDEVHRLDSLTAGMLLTALQTDGNGYFSFSPLGSDSQEKSKFQPVFATNRSIGELREQLGDDFVDRISQRMIVLPAFTKEEVLQVWSKVWEEMRFTGFVSNPLKDGNTFATWLQEQKLEGGFRDLQYISILVADYQRRNKDVVYTEQKLLDWLNKQMAMRRPAKQNPEIKVPFDITDEHLTEKNYITACRRAFVRAMKERYGKAKDVVNKLNKRGSKMTESKLSNWSNGEN